MDQEGLETFLAVARFGGMGPAAEELHVGQGTVSARIRHMEDELGITLFVRARGVKGVSLTPEGTYLLPIAQQQVNLYRQASSIKTINVRRTIRVVATETLNLGVLARAYRRLVSERPEIRLHVESHHTRTIYDMLESQQADIGFAFYPRRSKYVEACELFAERWGVLYHKGELFETTGRLTDLDPSREVRRIWSPEFESWHHRQIRKGSDPNESAILVGSPNMISSVIGAPGLWSIVPPSIAHTAQSADPDLRFSSLDECPPPSLNALVLLQRRPLPWLQDAVDSLLDSVRRVIDEDEDLRLL